MTDDEKYMHRCLQLAANGRGYVSPNPMVGAVVVHNNKIVGEGYHRMYGEAHAEVNALRSMKNTSCLKESTLYVSLEPCSHHGKTPPCSQLIIDNCIPKVVVACLDPFSVVAGRGIEMLQNAGIDVVINVLEQEALTLNKEFITAQTHNRPYIYLKWAQTQDGYIDMERGSGAKKTSTPISTDFTKILTHKNRAQIASIGIGTNTAVNDNPLLTTRLWYGRNPVRIILDRVGRIPPDYFIWDGKVPTIVFTETLPKNPLNNVTYEKIAFDKMLLSNMFFILKAKNINSIMIEGGSQLLQSIINQELWDEAYVETSEKKFGSGIKAPQIKGNIDTTWKWGRSVIRHLTNS